MTFVASNMVLLVVHVGMVAAPFLARLRRASVELPLHNIWGDDPELEAVTSVRIIDVIDRDFKNDLTDELPTPSEEISAIFDSTTGALSA